MHILLNRAARHEIGRKLHERFSFWTALGRRADRQAHSGRKIARRPASWGGFFSRFNVQRTEAVDPLPAPGSGGAGRPSNAAPEVSFHSPEWSGPKPSSILTRCYRVNLEGHASNYSRRSAAKETGGTANSPGLSASRILSMAVVCGDRFPPGRLWTNSIL